MTYKIIEDSFLGADAPNPDISAVRRWIGQARQEGEREGYLRGLWKSLLVMRRRGLLLGIRDIEKLIADAEWGNDE